MLYDLLVPLAKDSILFNVFRYITFRAAMATVTAIVISFVLGPWLIGWLRTLPLRSVMSAHLTSSFSLRKTPSVPWYEPRASTTSSPSRSAVPASSIETGLVIVLHPFVFFALRQESATRNKTMPATTTARHPPEELKTGAHGL